MTETVVTVYRGSYFEKSEERQTWPARPHLFIIPELGARFVERRRRAMAAARRENSTNWSEPVHFVYKTTRRIHALRDSFRLSRCRLCKNNMILLATRLARSKGTRSPSLNYRFFLSFTVPSIFIVQSYDIYSTKQPYYFWRDSLLRFLPKFYSYTWIWCNFILKIYHIFDAASAATVRLASPG